MAMIKTINLITLLILNLQRNIIKFLIYSRYIPSQLFVDWVNQQLPESDHVSLEAFYITSTQIYLAPYSDNEDDIFKFVNENYMKFIENELSIWSENKRDWPSFNQELFDEWFTVDYSQSVYSYMDID